MHDLRLDPSLGKKIFLMSYQRHYQDNRGIWLQTDCSIVNNIRFPECDNSIVII